MSPGLAKQETALLDASNTDHDVFFLTSAQLVPQDQDSGLDIYDAHVCAPSSPCVTPPPEPNPACSNESSSNGSSTSQPAAARSPPSWQPAPGNAGKRVALRDKAK